MDGSDSTLPAKIDATRGSMTRLCDCDSTGLHTSLVDRPSTKSNQACLLLLPTPLMCSHLSFPSSPCMASSQQSQASLLLQKQLRGLPSFPQPSTLFWLLTDGSDRILSMLFFFFLISLDLNKKPVDGFSAGLVDDSNIFEWSVTIIGPPDTL